MEKKFKLGVVGAGFMSSAIVSGAIKSCVVEPSEIIVSDVNKNSLDKMSSISVATTMDNKYLADNSEFVLFAVKPQSLDEVLASIVDCKCSKFISIMAGVKKSKIKNTLKDVFVARCMPNTPCSIGYGAIGLDLSDFSNKVDINFIKLLLSSLADVVEVSEEKLNAVTGVSGSSPAYFYLFLKGIIEGGIKNGLSYEEAKKLATSTMIGAGYMVLSNGEKSLDDLINAVCSKGGTTIEAIKVYNENNISKITEMAVDACVKRAYELENL